MRVLLTTDTVGGVWTFTRELAEGLLKLGHDVGLVSFGRYPNSSQADWCSMARNAYGGCFTYHASEIPLEWMQDNRGVYEAGAAVIKDFAQRFSPDILHSSQFCWGAVDVNIPKLITAHSDVLSWARAAKPEALTGSPWLDQYRLLVQSGLDGADAVVTPTQWMQDALRKHFNFSCRSEVVYNGRTLPPCTSDESERKLQAVTAGRVWDQGKGLRILRDVMAAMPVMLAGQESFEGEPANLPASVVALGALEEAELFRLFRQSSVYLVTSVYEPFGLAPLEAALCGCAVLARDVASLHEVWGDAAVYFSNAGELEAMLRVLSANTALLRRLQAASSAHALRFTAERMTADYAALYRSLLTDGEGRLALGEGLVANAH